MSPYENLLRQEDYRRVGLCALVRAGMEEQLRALGHRFAPPESPEFRSMHVYLVKLAGYSCVFVYLETDQIDVERIPAMLRGNAAFSVFTHCLAPHPRAAPAGSPWIRMELINAIGPTIPSGRQTRHMGFFTRLRPERELSYRTLHQTNWPGVVDQMARSQYRCWTTFLIEIGSELALFTYCQYVGQNKTADDIAMAADPTTQRWWTHTQPCLQGSSEDPNPWLEIPELSGADVPAL